MNDLIECFFDSDEDTDSNDEQQQQDAINKRRQLLQQPIPSFTPNLCNANWYLNDEQIGTVYQYKFKWDKLYLDKDYCTIVNDFEQNEDVFRNSERGCWKELIDTYVRSLVHLSTLSNDVQLYCDKLDHFANTIFQGSTWQKNSIKSKALFQLFIWEQKARILANSNDADHIKQAIHFLQMCIHCQSSLPALNTEFALTTKEESGPNYLDSLYLGKARSYSLWTLLSKCYGKIGFTRAETVSAKHAQAVRRQENSEDSPHRTTTPHTQIDEQESFFTQSNEFDKEFVKIYLATVDNIHQVMHGQRKFL
jgi:hypothetical protein